MIEATGSRGSSGPWLSGDDIDNDIGILEVEITKMIGKHFFALEKRPKY